MGHIRSLFEDESAFDAIFREYYARLSLFAHSILKSEDDARDVVQECFVKLWIKPLTLKRPEAIKSYLYSTVKNASFNFLRSKRTVDKNHLEIARRNDEADDNWLDKITEAEIIAEIFRAIDSLPVRMQQVFRKSTFENKNTQEIASELHTSASTVRKQKARALELLKEKLGKLVPIVFFI